MDCVRQIATAACGKEAADHQVRKEKLFIQPLAREIKCDLDPEKGVVKVDILKWKKKTNKNVFEAVV